MGISRHVAPHGAQPEPLGRVIRRRLDPPVIQHDRLGPAAFKEEFPVIRPGSRGAQHGQRGRFVKRRLKGAERSIGHVGSP